MENLTRGLAKPFFLKNYPDQVILGVQVFVLNTLNILLCFLEIFLSGFSEAGPL